jgi:hypothetical protein
MNETEDSNENRNEVYNMMKQHPNILDMMYIYTARNENNRNKTSFKS